MTVNNYESKFSLCYLIGAPLATIGITTFIITTINENIIGSLFGVVMLFIQSLLIIQSSISIKVSEDSIVLQNIITSKKRCIKLKDIINSRFKARRNEGITYLFNTRSGEIKINLIKACYKNLDEFNKIIRLKINKAN